MEFLVGTLCISIGCAVAWVVALYSQRGTRYLIWDTFSGTVGAALCAWLLSRFAPAMSVIGLVIAGPVFAAVAIWLGDAARRAAVGVLRREMP